MDNQKNSEDDINDDELEPQIISTDPNERKLARRLRIQRRLEAIRKQELLAEGLSVEEDVKKTLLEEQVEVSEEQLLKLALEGKELVTNVRVANFNRETQRREQEDEAKATRLAKLEEEAEKSMEMFEAINAKWDNIVASNDPLDIFHDIEAQKVKCRELIEQKNRLIDELRQDIKLVDEQFDKDQRKQKDDLALIVNRIDNQVNVMRRAYRHELNLIEQAISIERKQQIDAANKKWDLLYKEREKEEENNMKKKFEQVNELEDEINKINIDHQELFRETKIKLETDIQVLQLELEQVKALCLLNSEKLDYNFQVLKQRDEENVIIKAQQKRRINRLQDVLNSLRKKISDTQKTTESEKMRLANEVVKLHHSIIDIEKKADHFSEVNDRIYHQVWAMNAGTAKQLLERIITIDRIIYEQQLGLDWSPPETNMVEKFDLPSYRNAVQAVSESAKQKDKRKHLDVKVVSAVPPVIALMKKNQSEQRLLRHILHQIADRSGFLIEKRIYKLLFPYRKKEKTLVKIDNVFAALGIESEAEMLVLRDYFLPYTTCQACLNMCSEDRSEGRDDGASIAATKSSLNSGTNSIYSKLNPDMKSEEDVGSFEGDHLEEKSNILLLTAKEIGRGADSGSQDLQVQYDDDGNEIPIVVAEQPSQNPHLSNIIKVTQMKQKCQLDHVLAIDPIYILQALREFVENFKGGEEKDAENMATRLTTKRNTISRLITEEDVIYFWGRFVQIFSLEREKVWDGLLVGLRKYHFILEERHRLNKEAAKLRSQNNELKRLLQTYITSHTGEASTFRSSQSATLPPIQRNLSGKKEKPTGKIYKSTHRRLGTS